MRDDGRYRIDDEPARMPFHGMELLIFLSLPATVFLSLSQSLLFLAIPGLIGLFIGGRHRLFDPLMCGLSFVIFLLAAIAVGLLLDMGLDGLLAEYTRDLMIAVMFLPQVHSVIQQQRTVQLRASVAL